MPPMPTDRDMLHSKPTATAGGLVAIMMWSTSVAVVRGMSESLGTFKGAAAAVAVGGVLALAISFLRGRSPVSMLRLGWKYLLICGGLFVTYTVAYYAAMGLAPNRSTAIVAGLLNYLWPSLMVALAVPILHRKARWMVYPGVALAFAGSAVAVLGARDFSLAALREAGVLGWLSLPLMVAAAVCWGLYSNLTTRWGPKTGGAVPLFILASAGGISLCGLTTSETLNWSTGAAVEFGIVVAVCAVAYPLWEFGTRRGNQKLLSLVSLALPVMATGLATVYLQVRPGVSLVIGCLLVAIGAWVCRRSMKS